MNRFRSNFILASCAVFSLIAGLYPFNFADGTSRGGGAFPWRFVTALLVPIEFVGLRDLLQNILCFLPWGALVYVFVASPRWLVLRSVFTAAVVGGMVSFAIELCQVFFTRHPSIFDVLANTLGAALGALLCALSPIDVRRVVARSLARAEPSRALLPAALSIGQ